MLRRVARILRAFMFGVGICLFLWVPASYFVDFVVQGDVGSTDMSVWVRGNRVDIDVGVTERPYPAYFEVVIESSEQRRFRFPLLPEWWRPPWGGKLFVRIPLWLLAFLCLAWPVTSFLLARRRRGRGFPVEAVGTPL